MGFQVCKGQTSHLGQGAVDKGLESLKALQGLNLSRQPGNWSNKDPFQAPPGEMAVSFNVTEARVSRGFSLELAGAPT